MTTIRTKQLVKYLGQPVPLPKVGERMTNKAGAVATVAAVRLIGKPRGGMLLNGYSGTVQEYEMDLN